MHFKFDTKLGIIGSKQPDEIINHFIASMEKYIISKFGDEKTTNQRSERNILHINIKLTPYLIISECLKRWDCLWLQLCMRIQKANFKQQ